MEGAGVQKPEHALQGRGISFVDGQLYWISDANGPKRTTRHLPVQPGRSGRPAKHTMLFNLGSNRET